jgi:hypothetical protein
LENIVGGNPAKLIKYRFSENIRRKLIQVKIEKIFEKANNNNFALLHRVLDDNNIDEIIS